MMSATAPAKQISMQVTGFVCVGRGVCWRNRFSAHCCKPKWFERVFNVYRCLYPTRKRISYVQACFDTDHGNASWISVEACYDNLNVSLLCKQINSADYDWFVIYFLHIFIMTMNKSRFCCFSRQGSHFGGGFAHGAHSFHAIVYISTQIALPLVQLVRFDHLIRVAVQKILD